MKIVVLDGYTENPGDLSWDALKELGEVEVYDRTSYEESPLIAERIGDAEIVVINKTPISKETMDKCENIKLIAVLATGYNVVDYAYAKEKGIPVVNVSSAIGSKNNDYVVPNQFSHNLTLSYSLQNGRYNVSLECRNFTNENLYDNFSLQKAGRAAIRPSRVPAAL